MLFAGEQSSMAFVALSLVHSWSLPQAGARKSRPFLSGQGKLERQFEGQQLAKSSMLRLSNGRRISRGLHIVSCAGTNPRHDKENRITIGMPRKTYQDATHLIKSPAGDVADDFREGKVEPLGSQSNVTSEDIRDAEGRVRSALGRHIAKRLAQLHGHAARVTESLLLRARAALATVTTLGTVVLGGGAPSLSGRWIPLRAFAWQRVVGERKMALDAVDLARAVQRIARRRAVLTRLRGDSAAGGIASRVFGTVAKLTAGVEAVYAGGVARHKGALAGMKALQLGRRAPAIGSSGAAGSPKSRRGARLDSHMQGSRHVSIVAEERQRSSRHVSSVAEKRQRKNVRPNLSATSSTSRSFIGKDPGTFSAPAGRERWPDAAVARPLASESAKALRAVAKSSTTLDVRGPDATARTRAGGGALVKAPGPLGSWGARAVLVSIGLGAALTGSLPATLVAAAAAIAAASSAAAIAATPQPRRSAGPLRVPGLRRSRALRQLDAALHGRSEGDSRRPKRMRDSLESTNADGGEPAAAAAHSLAKALSPHNEARRRVPAEPADSPDASAAFVDAVDAAAYAVLPSEPAVFAVPVLGAVLGVLDRWAYAVEQLVGRVTRRLEAAGWLPGGVVRGTRRRAGWRVHRSIAHRLLENDE